MNNRILIVAAHPDDEVLGCGGVMSKLSGQKKEITTLIMGEGVTSRYEDDDIPEGEIDNLHESAKNANRLLGINDIRFLKLPDNRFDSLDLLDIIKPVEKIINELKPQIVFTHFHGDLNIDHRITYKAVITSARPVDGSPVKEIYSFESLSSTEWNFSQQFSPDVFFNISSDFNYKMKALQEYKSELRSYPHPRSLKGVEALARNRGTQSGFEYAEAFKTVRVIND